MRTSSLLTSLSVVSAVSAAKSYMPYIWNNTALDLHNLPVQARFGRFYAGGDADTVCPTSDPDCYSSNKTILYGPTASKYDDKPEAFWLSILDPQGQEVVTDGVLGFEYTLPKTDLVLPDDYAVNTPFHVDLDDFSNQTVLRYNGNDFVTCEPDGIIWPLAMGNIVYAGGFKCTPFKMRLEETDAQPVEYYKRDCDYGFRVAHPNLCLNGPMCCGIPGDCPKGISGDDFKKMHNITECP